MVAHSVPSNTMATTRSSTPCLNDQSVILRNNADSNGVREIHVVLPSQSPPPLQHYPTSPASFTEQEDEFLKELVKRYGTKRWHIIAAKMQNKTPHECRKRWQTYLHMCMNKSSWSTDEDRILLEGHNTFGNRWTEIAKLVPGRTDNAVKNRYNALCKKHFQKSKPATTGSDMLSNIEIGQFTNRELKRIKTYPEWRQDREDSHSCSLCDLIHREIHILPRNGDYVCLEPKRQVITSYLPQVNSCNSPKETQTDMEEVMGWLTARTPTPECEEKDRSNLISSSSSMQKHRESCQPNRNFNSGLGIDVDMTQYGGKCDFGSDLYMSFQHYGVKATK